MRKIPAILIIAMLIVSSVWAGNTDQAIKRVQWSREMTAKLTTADKTEQSVSRLVAPNQKSENEIRRIRKTHEIRHQSAEKSLKTVDWFKLESLEKSISPVKGLVQNDTLLIGPDGIPDTVSYVVGENVTLAIVTGTDTAVVNFFVDNGDSIYTPGNELMMDDKELVDVKLWDGVEFDESPAGDGIFVATLNTLSLGDGPGPIFAVQNAIVFLDVYWMNSMLNNYGVAYVGAPDENTSISGMVITVDEFGTRYPAVNVVVIAVRPDSMNDQKTGFLTKTDVNGEYCIQIPDGFRGQYQVFAHDVWQQYPGMLADPPNYMLDVWGDIPGVNFTLMVGNELIYGFVKDEKGVGIQDVPVFAESGAQYLETLTDSQGYYEFHVNSGWWWVDVDYDFVDGQYMHGEGHDLEVVQGGNHQADFALYVLNEYFTGHVTRIDGSPVAGVDVYTDIWIGDQGFFNSTKTDVNGDYALGVSAALQGVVNSDEYGYVDTSSYYLSAWYDNAIINPWGYERLYAPRSGLDFTVIIPDAYLSGTIYNANDNTGLYDAGVHAYIINETGGLDYWAFSDENGHYEIPLVGGMPPNGNFWNIEVFWPWEWTPSVHDSINVISGNHYNRDYYIQPPVTEGFISGYVYNSDGVGIVNAKVEVYGPQYYEVYTDGSGFFSVSHLTFGTYNLTAYADGYDPYNIYDVWVGPDPVYLEFWMGSIVGNLTINGHIRDAATTTPISSALLMAFNWDYYDPYTLFVDSTGYYELKVKAGNYDFMVGANGYWKQSLYGLYITADTTLDFNLATATTAISDTLFGSVIDDAGNALRKVFAIFESDTYIGYTYTDFYGEYQIGLPNGYYNATYSKNGFNTEWRSFDFPSGHPGDPIMLFSTNYVFGPQIVAIEDVPEDQGKQVRLTWKRAEGLVGAVSEYHIYRAVERFSGPEATPETPYEWDYVMTVPVNPQMDHYNVVVPTLYDKVGDNVYWSGFMVCAIGWDFWSYWNSNIMAGWSEDNLAPEIPKNLAGSVNPGNITVTWDEVTSEPVKYYSVYRKVGASEMTLLAYTTETEYVDNTATVAADYQYAISATDYGMNESPITEPINLSLTSITSGRALPTEFGLAQNFPNPFNPVTTIEIALPKTSMATLTIYNLMGQVIREFNSGTLSAGYHTFVWDACNQSGARVGSGIYIYTLTAGDFTQTKKMILMR